jgi:hypothetical protein
MTTKRTRSDAGRALVAFRKLVTINCTHCGAHVQKRTGTQFCSGRCRVATHRAVKKGTS